MTPRPVLPVNRRRARRQPLRRGRRSLRQTHPRCPAAGVEDWNAPASNVPRRRREGLEPAPAPRTRASERPIKRQEESFPCLIQWGESGSLRLILQVYCRNRRTRSLFFVISQVYCHRRRARSCFFVSARSRRPASGWLRAPPGAPERGHIQDKVTGIFGHIRAYSSIFGLLRTLRACVSLGKAPPGQAHSLHAPFLFIKLTRGMSKHRGFGEV